MSGVSTSVAVITGAGSGIGAALSVRAAVEGMTVVLADVAGERIAEVARAITDKGGIAYTVLTDVTDVASVERVARYTLDQVGVPTLLANNAGIEALGHLWDITPALWRRVQAVNVDGAFYGLRAFLPAMIDAGGERHVLNTSSVGGISVGGSMTPYTVSKHAIRVMSECLCIELAEIGSSVQVHVLLPGPVDTNIFRDAESVDTDGFATTQLARMRSYLSLAGMPPAELAELTFAAMERGEFWIYPHPDMARQALAVRSNVLVHQLRPSDGG
jgi:NAD(P)-dependent dehydrogenase (short-subunit alcohol dehydrogenase family)